MLAPRWMLEQERALTTVTGGVKRKSAAGGAFGLVEVEGEDVAFGQYAAR